MNKTDEILNKIIEWAKEEELVRGLIMVGSKALSDATDDLADIDISVFFKDKESFIRDASWISKIAKVWVYSPDEHYYGDTLVPTRLVIYEDGVKVDYSLCDIEVIEFLAKNNHFDTGYKILIDKDGLMTNFKEPSFKPSLPKKPTEEEFIHIIKEFWFEAYHVAKYLKREDLWLVKFRDWSLQVYLITMMEWLMLARNNWDYDVKWNGKHIKKWLDPKIYERLNEIFSHFDKEDSWTGLIARLNLFRDLSKETAQLLGYPYPEDTDKNLTGFINNLYEN